MSNGEILERQEELLNMIEYLSEKRVKEYQEEKITVTVLQ